MLNHGNKLLSERHVSENGKSVRSRWSRRPRSNSSTQQPPPTRRSGRDGLHKQTFSERKAGADRRYRLNIPRLPSGQNRLLPYDSSTRKHWSNHNIDGTSVFWSPASRYPPDGEGMGGGTDRAAAIPFICIPAASMHGSIPSSRRCPINQVVVSIVRLFSVSEGI